MPWGKDSPGTAGVSETGTERTTAADAAEAAQRTAHAMLKVKCRFLATDE